MPEDWHRRAVTNQIGKLRRKAEREGHAAPSWSAIRRAIDESWSKGFACACYDKVLVWRSEGETMPIDSFSIDYYEPPKRDANESNLIVTCVGCNVARAHRPVSAFRSFIKRLSPQQRSTVHHQALHGKIVENYEARG
jgi:hypothetical protein